MNRQFSAACAAAVMTLFAGGAWAHDGHDKKSPAGTSPAAPADVAFQQAAAAVDAFHAALARGDAAGAAAVLSDDALIYEQGFVERSKAEYASHHLPGDAAYAQATRYTLASRGGRVAGDLAYIVSEGRTVGRHRDKEVDRVTLETAVLRRIAGEWKIVHVHWSSRDSTR